jgi:hypothetical protein
VETVRLSKREAEDGAVANVDRPGAVPPHEVDAHVRIERPGEVVEQTYRLAADGRLLGIQQMTTGGRRDLVAEEEDV